MTAARAARWAVLLAAVAELAAVAVLSASTLVTIHSWRDIAVGTGTAYCGVHVQSVDISFYCQHGH